MTLPPTISRAIMDTVLGHLAILFLTGAAGDLTVAHRAALQMLAACDVASEEELSLAAEIISFRLHALQALSAAGNPELSLNQILRLRGGAVSLSREQHKAQRKLDQLQRARYAGTQPQTPRIEPHPEPAAPPHHASEPQPEPQIEPLAEPLADPIFDNPLGLFQTARQAPQFAAKAADDTWSQAFQKRQTTLRMAEKLKKNQDHTPSQPAYISNMASAGPA
jgi:hypothetical protein